MTNKDIIQELNDLGSNLLINASQAPYAVPEGYFDGFADGVLDLVKAGEDPAWLTSLPKNTPYGIPSGYFDALDQTIMRTIKDRSEQQSSKEELEAISPLLSSLQKRPVYSVPEGYFENFKVSTEQVKTGSKVISFSSRKWFRYVAAAVITSILVTTVGLMIFKNNHKDAAGRTLAKFEKEVKKIDDVKTTESLIDFMDAGLNEKEMASNHKAIKTDDVQKLLQDVSSDELNDFNEQSKDIEDVMMTN